MEFDKAIVIYPMSVEMYLGKAEAYEEMDNLESALAVLEAGYMVFGRLQKYIKRDGRK